MFNTGAYQVWQCRVFSIKRHGEYERSMSSQASCVLAEVVKEALRPSLVCLFACGLQVVKSFGACIYYSPKPAFQGSIRPAEWLAAGATNWRWLRSNWLSVLGTKHKSCYNSVMNPFISNHICMTFGLQAESF